MINMLDKIDKKILAELDKDSRQTFSQISRKVGTSKEVVRYRFEQLKENKIILNCHALIDTYKLGYLIHIVWVKLEGVSEEDERKIIELLTKSKKVGVVTKVFGDWDLVFGIWAKNVIEFNKLYREITNSFIDKIRDQMITIELNCNYKSRDFVYDYRIPPKIIGGELIEKKLDEKDQVIIMELAKNSRVNVVDLAQKVNITAKAVAERIKKLEKEDIIKGYMLNLNYEKLGFMHYRIFLKTTNIVESKIKKYLENRKRVISIMNYIGANNVEFRLGVKDTYELQEEMNNLKKEFGTDIKEYKSVLFLSSFEVLNFLPL
jgi:DNA-binding Lrp family transcriptional regulator